MLKNYTINFNAKIKPIKPINEEFTLCKCYILALGKNRNKTIISEEAVKEALPTLFNIPVVGHVFVDGEGIYRLGGHDMKLERDKDGKYSFKILTVPYGTVPEDNEVSYEEVVEPDGTTKTYLTANIILWTSRYSHLKETIYSEDVWFGQSMEIKAKEIARCKTEEDKDFIHISKFTFSGLCLLGKSDDSNFHYEPCFPESKVELIQFKLDESFMLAFEEMKDETKLLFNRNPQKEEEKVEKKNDDANDVKTNNQTQNSVNKGLNGTMSDKSTNTLETFAATYGSRRGAISDALRGFNVSNDAVCMQYFLADFDEKFIFVERYIATKDNPSGKFSKGRMSYEMCADESVAVSEKTFESMLIKWLTVEEGAALDRQRDELTALSTYKEKHEKTEQERKMNEITETFSDLAEDEAFIELAKKHMNFLASEFDAKLFETECFAIRGKKMPSKTPLKMAVGNDTKTKNSKYGEFFENYLGKNE